MDILSWKLILKLVYSFGLVSDLLQLENLLADQYASLYIHCSFITKVITPNTLKNFFRYSDVYPTRCNVTQFIYI